MTEIFDNIRGIYDFSLPCEELRPFIEFFSESSRERTVGYTGSSDFMVEMFASWTPTFWINLGSSYRLSTGHGCYDIPSGKDVIVLRESLVCRHNQPTDDLFTVKFFPGGLEAVLGICQTAFVGRVVGLEDLLPAALIEQVRAGASFAQRMGILQDYFLACFARRRVLDHYQQLVRDSIGYFVADDMQPNTSQLAERLFVQSKTMNRYFQRVIGVSPKGFFSILRARVALTSYVGSRCDFEPTVFGYYDHSHFYKAVRQFTGRRLAPICP